MSQAPIDHKIAPNLLRPPPSYAHEYAIDEGNSMVEMNLHEQLLAATGSGLGQSISQVSGPHVQQVPNNHAGSPHDHQHMRQAASSARPLAPHIDPAIASSYHASGGNGGQSSDLSGGEGKRGGKRELSKSKRAEQNRAAQRAFRQRKEGYIKKLEEQVTSLGQPSHDSYAQVTSDNYRLRDYITTLQLRLLEIEQTYPSPPPDLNLRDPRSLDVLNQMQVPTAPMDSSSVSQLQAAAVAAAQRSPGYEGRKEMEQTQYTDTLGYHPQRSKVELQAGGSGTAESFTYDATDSDKQHDIAP